MTLVQIGVSDGAAKVNDEIFIILNDYCLSYRILDIESVSAINEDGKIVDILQVYGKHKSELYEDARYFNADFLKESAYIDERKANMIVTLNGRDD